MLLLEISEDGEGVIVGSGPDEVRVVIDSAKFVRGKIHVKLGFDGPISVPIDRESVRLRKESGEQKAKG